MKLIFNHDLFFASYFSHTCTPNLVLFRFWDFLGGGSGHSYKSDEQMGPIQPTNLIFVQSASPKIVWPNLRSNPIDLQNYFIYKNEHQYSFFGSIAEMVWCGPLTGFLFSIFQLSLQPEILQKYSIHVVIKPFLACFLGPKIGSWQKETQLGSTIQFFVTQMLKHICNWWYIWRSCYCAFAIKCEFVIGMFIFYVM